MTKRCLVRKTDGDQVGEEHTLLIELGGRECDIAADENAGFILMMLMDAMKEGRDICLHGKVCGELLGNLTEFQTAWRKWLPGTYRCVQIHTDGLLEAGVPKPGAICAFTGGVDATFSVQRNHGKRNGYRSHSIHACVFVHGFDVPIHDRSAFDRILSVSGKVLGSLDIPLTPVRTNFREISKVNWEHTFATALAGVLCQYSPLAGTGIIGSSEPYDSLVIPLGSSPVTDHLLSKAGFKIMHDGASHSRTEKVLEIAEWPEGRDHLRVCWEGEQKDQNCGRCEKCLRTKLNFLANGLMPPSCLPGGIPVPAEILAVRFRNEAVRAEWLQIAAVAKKNGTIPELRFAIENHAQNAPRPLGPKEPLFSRIRTALWG